MKKMLKKFSCIGASSSRFAMKFPAKKDLTASEVYLFK